MSEKKRHAAAFVASSPMIADALFKQQLTKEQQLLQQQQQQQLMQQQQQQFKSHSAPNVPTLTMPDRIQNTSNNNNTNGNVSPRGRNIYQVQRQWSMTCMAAWIALFLGFFSIVMLGILYGTRTDGSIITSRSDGEVIEKRNELEIKQPTVGVAAVGGGTVQFTVRGIPGQYSRWPPGSGIIEGLDVFSLSETRLCCLVGKRYFICDYGQGASSDLGIECFVEYLATENGAHLLVNVQSDHMNGAQCFFHWKEQQQQQK